MTWRVHLMMMMLMMMAAMGSSPTSQLDGAVGTLGLRGGPYKSC
jgi:hypothetical protein